MMQHPDLVGQQFGNYRLLRLLGKGGFAEVYLGEHIDLGTQAAIKVLHTQLDSTDIDSFRTEARTIARLRHSHIIRVLDFNAAGSTPFLVMDYAAGGTMRERYPKGSIVPLPTIVSYVRQAADALQYAHDQKLVHRDIKPENMLLDQYHNLLLSDFGIALVAQSSRYQGTQDVIGTASYMSPEQIQGKPRPASDQYSLAVVVYEWLCGTRPFEGSLSELWSQHMFTSPPLLREKLPTIPPDVERVVTTALAKDPKQRFGSVHAFATALERAYENILSSRPQSHPLSSSTPLPPPTLLSNPPTLTPPPTVPSPTFQSSQTPLVPYPTPSAQFPISQSSPPPPPNLTPSTLPQTYPPNPYAVPSTPPLTNPYAPRTGYPYQPQKQEADPNAGFAITGMILGIISLISLCAAGLGVITAIVGIFISIRGRRSASHRGMANAGLTMCIITLGIALVAAGVFVYIRTKAP